MRSTRNEPQCLEIMHLNVVQNVFTEKWTFNPLWDARDGFLLSVERHVNTPPYAVHRFYVLSENFTKLNHFGCSCFCLRTHDAEHFLQMEWYTWTSVTMTTHSLSVFAFNRGDLLFKSFPFNSFFGTEQIILAYFAQIVEITCFWIRAFVCIQDAFQCCAYRGL